MSSRSKEPKIPNRNVRKINGRFDGYKYSCHNERKDIDYERRAHEPKGDRIRIITIKTILQPDKYNCAKPITTMAEAEKKGL